MKGPSVGCETRVVLIAGDSGRLACRRFNMCLGNLSWKVMVRGKARILQSSPEGHQAMSSNVAVSLMGSSVNARVRVISSEDLPESVQPGDFGLSFLTPPRRQTPTSRRA